MPDLPPQPSPDPDSEAYWAHLAGGELAVQRCSACQRWQYPMLERCRHCAAELVLERVSGRGHIHSFIVEHHRVVPGFEDKRPYTIALVALEEAPHVRISGQIVGDDAGLQVGAPVVAETLELEGGDFRIPAFRLA